jgi:AraC-like DNA-binding protein
MSAKYTFLAWDTPVKNAPLKLALLQLANNADDDGFSYYSISKMALSCGMSDRTFMRKISELEELNILSVERRSNRPSLYTLIGDEMGVSLCHLQKTEVTECHGEVTECHLVGDRVSHDLNNTPNTSPESIYIPLFDQFWDMYDKKTGKPKCEKLWAKLKPAEVELIFNNLPAYVASTPDKQFRKGPERWLLNKCWNDEIEVNNGSTQSTGKKLSAYERARAANAEYRQQQPNERKVVVGTNDGHLGRAVDEGEGRATIEYVDNRTFIDYDQSS